MSNVVTWLPYLHFCTSSHTNVAERKHECCGLTGRAAKHHTQPFAHSPHPSGGMGEENRKKSKAHVLR